MKYSIVFKFLAIALCTLMLLGAAGSAIGIIVMTEAGLYDKTVDEMRQEYLHSDGAALADVIAQCYADAELGGYPSELVEPQRVYELGVQGRSGWFYGVFDPDATRYVLKDADGRVLDSGGTSGLTYAETYEFPVSGTYRYVLSVKPKQEAELADWPEKLETESAIPEDGAEVYGISIGYDGGSGSMASVDPIGFIHQEMNETVFFDACQPELLDIPLTTLTAVTFWDENGNVLYSAEDAGSVGTAFVDGEGFLHFESSAAEPQLLPEEGEINAVPADGADVYEVSFSYQSEQDSRNGASSRNPIGRLLYDEDGALLFQAYVYWVDIPEDAEIFSAEFRDQDDNILYRTTASVTDMTVDRQENGMLSLGFSASEADADAFPEETVSGTAALRRETAGAMESSETVPETTAVATAETAPETVPTAAAQTQPEEKTDETEPVLTVEPALTTEPTSTDEPGSVTFTDERIRTYEYWDTDAQQTMVVEYRLAQMPEYTVELSLASGAYRYDADYALLTRVWNYRNDLFKILGGSLLLFAVLAVYLCCAAGRKPGAEEVRAAGFNAIPLDAYLVGGGMLIFVLVELIVEYSDALVRHSIQTACAGVAGAGYLMCLIFVGFCFACAAQFKTPGGYWWRNSICWRLIKLADVCFRALFRACVWLLRRIPKIFTVLWGWVLAVLRLFKRAVLWLWRLVKKAAAKIGKMVNRCYSMIPLTWQWLLTGFIMVLLLFVSLAAESAFMMVLSLCACMAVVLYGAYCFGTLQESAQRMSKGDLDTKVDDKLLAGAFRDFSGNLNDLAGVAVVAAQKQLKSERMKTELITNVSHDIKTPLTSIINYVDLLQKPHTPEEEKAYLEVLNRQSQRLKKLIDDLMEMSKASTGNLTVDITRLDAVESVNQALGEFADKLDRAQLTPVFRRPEQPIAMMADGRLVWRVLSNLLSNAVKYALPGTRLYIDLMELEGRVIISLKNISRDELNVDAEELMERFVRGDDSRNTEGSGLGLNIAKTLMELQKGQLQLLVDGDLFKVTLLFPSA